MDEAAISLRRMLQSDQSPWSSRELLAKLLFRKAFLCAQGGDWGQAAVALREAVSCGPEPARPGGGDPGVAIALAIVYQLGGLQIEAASLWEDARRGDPKDADATHSLFISSLVRALRGESSEGAGGEMCHWRAATFNALLLMQKGTLGEEFRRRCEHRYGQSISPKEVGQLWARFEQMLKKHLPLPATLGLIFDVERASERALQKLGGLPPSAESDRGCIMGAVMLRHLGHSKEFSTFVARLLKEREQNGQAIRIVKAPAAGATYQTLPSAKEMLRLLRYFSCYSTSQVLLDQGFPQTALGALEFPCEEVCVTGPATFEAGQRWSPHVCQQSCEKFLAVNPAYAELENGPYLLWRGAVDLAAEAHAALGCALLSPAGPDVVRAFEHWREALRLSGEEGRAELSRAAMKRARACASELSGAAQFDKAVHVLEEACGFCGPEFADELNGMLSEALNYRGVQKANVEPPDWDDCTSDFKRSVELNPFVPITVRNLAYVLRQKAVMVHVEDVRGAARLLFEAHEVLRKAAERTPGEPELMDEMNVLLDDMEQLSVLLGSLPSYFYLGEPAARDVDRALAADLLARARASRKLRIRVLDGGEPPQPAPRIRVLLPEESAGAAEAVRTRALRIKIHD